MQSVQTVFSNTWTLLQVGHLRSRTPTYGMLSCTSETFTRRLGNLRRPRFMDSGVLGSPRVRAAPRLVQVLAHPGLQEGEQDTQRVVRHRRIHDPGIQQEPLADSLITLHIIDEMLDVDLHGWTPVRDRGMRWHQYTRSSHATTPEANKSEQRYIERHTDTVGS
jgi:hypothetical protein